MVAAMSAEERERWNARYRATTAVPEQPARFLASVADLLPGHGRALDVAGGSGRNALWLARRGLEVTLVDIAEQGLALATETANRHGLPIRTACIDLEHEPLPPGPWDLIIDVHFLLRPLIPHLARALAPGGVLAFAHPTVINLQHHAQPSPRYLLETNELPRLLHTLQPVLYREGWNEDGRHEAELVARRPP
jgi:tellurite methyltransferase